MGRVEIIYGGRWGLKEKYSPEDSCIRRCKGSWLPPRELEPKPLSRTWLQANSCDILARTRDPYRGEASEVLAGKAILDIEHVAAVYLSSIQEHRDKKWDIRVDIFSEAFPVIADSLIYSVGVQVKSSDKGIKKFLSDLSDCSAGSAEETLANLRLIVVNGRGDPGVVSKDFKEQLLSLNNYVACRRPHRLGRVGTLMAI